MLWYSALVRWRHKRRPRNYRFIQWGWKRDAKKRHFPNEFRKTLWQDFNWVIEDCFLLLLLTFGRHAFFDRSAALIIKQFSRITRGGQKREFLEIDRCMCWSWPFDSISRDQKFDSAWLARSHLMRLCSWGSLHFLYYSDKNTVCTLSKRNVIM